MDAAGVGVSAKGLGRRISYTGTSKSGADVE